MDEKNIEEKKGILKEIQETLKNLSPETINLLQKDTSGKITHIDFSDKIEVLLKSFKIFANIKEVQEKAKTLHFFGMGCRHPLLLPIFLLIFTLFGNLFLQLVLLGSFKYNTLYFFLLTILISIVLIATFLIYLYSPRFKRKRKLYDDLSKIKKQSNAIKPKLMNLQVPQDISDFIYPILLVIKRDILPDSLVNIRFQKTAKLHKGSQTQVKTLANRDGVSTTWGKTTLTTYENKSLELSFTLQDKTRVLLETPYVLQKLHGPKRNRRRTKIKWKTKYKIYFTYDLFLRFPKDKNIDLSEVKKLYPKAKTKIEKNVLRIRLKAKAKTFQVTPNLNTVLKMMATAYNSIKSSPKKI